MKRLFSILLSFILLQGLSCDNNNNKIGWKNQLIKKGELNSPVVEVTPFVFKNKYYLLENWRGTWVVPHSPRGRRMDPEMWIKEVETGKYITRPMVNQSLGIAFVWDEKVHVLGVSKTEDRKRVNMTWSADLKTWTDPIVVLKANPDEKYFNTSICRAKDRFIMLVETNDPEWQPFTFKYFESGDLKKWQQIPKALYGIDKYVGGPALYYYDEIFYTLYLQSLGKGYYETHVTRSKDLVHWQDAPKNRSVVTYDPNNLVHPIQSDTLKETNASDAELCYWQGKTRLYFTGGNQQMGGNLQWAEFDGTPKKLLEHYFEGLPAIDTIQK
jgi:alpha-L-fucosidase